MAVVAALKHAIDTGTEWAGTVNRIARVTGDSVEESSKLAFVFDRIGLSAESVTGPLAILNRNIQQGSEGIRRYFTGVELAELRTSSFSQQLPVLAAAYQKLNVGQERTTFLFNTFGRGGQELDRLLKLQTADLAALAAEAERFGLVLDATNAKTFKDYIQSHRAAEQASKGLQVQVGQLTLPIFEAFDKAMIAVLTTLTNLPAPVQTLIGLFAIGTIGIGKYAQTISALIGLGQGLVGFITRLVTQRGLDAAATVAQTAATTVSTAAIQAEIRAHQLATGAILSHAEAEAILAGSHIKGGAAGALAQAGPAVGTALGLAAKASLIASAAVIGAAIGTAISKSIVEPALDAAERANQRQRTIEDGNRQREAAIGPERFGEATQTLNELKDAGELSAAAIEALANSTNLVRMRRVVEEAGDLDAVLRDIVAEANAASESFDEATTTVADFVGIIGQLQAESIRTKAAQATLNTSLEASGVATAGGTQALATYAQQLFDVAKAAAAASGAEFDVAAARTAAAQAAIKAGEDFIVNQKKIIEAQEEGAERIADAEERLADAIEDAAKRNRDAQKNLADAIEDRAERISEAEEALADATLDRTERIKDAEENLAEVRKDSAERVKDARQRLADAEIDSAKAIKDAEKALTQARRERLRAITDAQFGLESALRAGDAEAEIVARRALASARSTKTIDDAEAAIVEAKAKREEQLSDLRADLAEARKEQLESIEDAEKNLADTTEDANKRVEESHERLADTIEETSERVVEAQERVTEAAEAGREAIEDAQEALRDANEAAIKAIDDLNDGLATSLYLLERMNEEAGNFRNQDYGNGPNAIEGGRVDRAHGGPVHPGNWGWVGEEGPEIVRWGAAGTVVNNDEVVAGLRELISQGSARSGGNTLNVNVPHQDVRLLFNQLRFLFGKQLRN